MTFADGAEYVGQTRMRVAQRLRMHKVSPVNFCLDERLQNETPTITVLSRHRKQSAADAAELRFIRALPNPINRLGVPGLPPSGNPPPDGRGMFERHQKKPYDRDKSESPARCSWCQKTKPAAEFSGDRSRHNGLCSRCNVCQNASQEARRKAKRNGEDVSAAYAAAKAAIQDAALAEAIAENDS